MRYRALLVIGPLVLVLVAAAVPSTVHRFSDLTSGRTQYGPGNSLRARLDLWRTNLPKVEHDPVLGNGFKSIVEDTTATKGSGVNVVQGAHSHSDFVRAVVELGVPGLVFFCWLLFGMWAGCRRSYRRARKGRDGVLEAVSLGALVAASAYIADERRLEPDDPGVGVGHVLDGGRGRPRRGPRRAANRRNGDRNAGGWLSTAC